MYSKLYSQNKEILHNTFFQYIVSGLIGVSGQNVPSLVEEEPKKGGGLKPQLPNMEEMDVTAVTQEDNLVMIKIVQVRR